MAAGRDRGRPRTSDEQGLALPVVLMALLLLAGLTFAFLAMAGMEPLIATNQRTGTQALVLAEAGLEHVLWALSAGERDPATPGGLAPPVPSPPPAPFDGSALLPLGPGGYSILVMPGAGREVRVRATGYVVRPGRALPSAPGGVTDANRLAQRTVEATLTWIGPPTTWAALSAGGSVELRGTTVVDGQGLVDPESTRSGSGSACSADRQAALAVRDRTRLPGADGLPGTADDELLSTTVSTAEAVQLRGSPALQVVPEGEFDQHALLGKAQLDFLRERARARGTYLRPTSQSPVVLASSDGSLNEGLVFVDTVGGAPLARAFTDPTVLATVRVAGPVRARGWLIVLGRLELTGDVVYEGLVYAAGDFRYRDAGTVRLRGAVVSANLGAAAPTVIDVQAPGSVTIAHDCTSLATGGGAFDPPRGYFVKPGTWREVSH